MRLGNIVNTYNVFQHFYPYFDEVAVNWELELENALERSFVDASPEEHLITLQKMTAPLKDGHIRVWKKGNTRYMLPIHWEWMEGKLVITDVLDENLGLKKGSIVTKINDQDAIDYFKEVNTLISAGTEGWLNYRAQTLSTLGDKDEEIILEVDNKTISLTHDRKNNYSDAEIVIQKYEHKILNENIHYLNLNTIEMDTITSLLPPTRRS